MKIKSVKVQSMKYRSRSSSQGACSMGMLRRNIMQGLKALATIVAEIARVDAKSVKATEA